MNQQFINDQIDVQKELHNQIKKLQAEVERLRHVLNEEADYCQSFADLFSNQDRERAARHQARADRLRNSAKEQAND